MSRSPAPGAIIGLGVVGLSPPSSHAASTPIKHVVVIMEENHTFDNYFGAFPGVNNNPKGPSGKPWGVTEPAASDPLPYDLSHSGPRAYGAIDGGAMNNFNPIGDVQYTRVTSRRTGRMQRTSVWARTSTPRRHQQHA